MRVIGTPPGPDPRSTTCSCPPGHLQEVVVVDGDAVGFLPRHPEGAVVHQEPLDDAGGEPPLDGGIAP
eukprot:16268841-Heterocapsa_arctica.AAC.1